MAMWLLIEEANTGTKIIRNECDLVSLTRVMGSEIAEVGIGGLTDPIKAINVFAYHTLPEVLAALNDG